MTRAGQRNPKRSGEPEISKLKFTGGGDQQVLRLEISVKDAMGVEVVDSIGELVGEFLRKKRREEETRKTEREADEGRRHLATKGGDDLRPRVLPRYVSRLLPRYVSHRSFDGWCSPC